MDAKAKILIVDDELSTRVKLQRILAKADYDVQAVAGGQEAVQVLAKTPMDVLFTDLRMKGLVSQAQRLSPETIVIILAGKTPLKSAVKAIPHNVYDYLVKPYGAEVVKRAACRAVEHKRMAARLEQLSALEARLRVSEEQHHTLIENVRDLSRNIAASLDLNTMIRQVSELIRQRFDYDVVLVLLIDQKGNRLVLREGAIGYAGRPLSAHSLEIGEGIIGWVAQTGETLWVNDVNQEPRFHYTDQLAETRAELAIPLKARGQCVGVLNIESARVNAFEQDDVITLKGLADELAVAIENTRLYQEVKQKANEMAMLQQVSEGINRTLVLDEVLQLVVDSAVAAVPAAETGSLFLADEKGDLVLSSGHGLKPSSRGPIRLRWGEGYCGWAAQKGQSLILDNVSEDPRAARWGESNISIQSAIVVPLQTKEKTIGALCLDNRSTRGAFDEQSLRLLQTFAHQSITAIENARLFEETKKRAKRQEALYRVSRTFAQVRGPQELCQAVVRAGHDILGHPSLGLFLLDPKTGDRVLQAQFGWEGVPAGWRIPPGEGLSDQAIVTGELQYFRDVTGELRYIPGLSNARCEVDVPIKIGTGVLGVLIVEETRVDAFDTGDFDVLQSVGNQLAIALQSARLFGETRHRVEQLAALNAAAVQIQQHMDSQKIFQATCDELQKFGTFASVFLVSDDGLEHLHTSMSAEMQREYVATFGERPVQFSMPMVSLAHVWEQLQAGQTIIEPDLLPRILAALSPELRPVGEWLSARSKPGSVLVAPLTRTRPGSSEETIGAIAIIGERWSESDISPIALFARHISVALENARLLEETECRVRELDALNRIATSITSTLDLERVLDLTMQEIKAVLSVEVCSLMLLDEQAHELVFKVSLGPGAEQAKPLRLGLNQGIAGWVAREGQPALVPDVCNDSRWYSQVDSTTGFTTRSLIAVPLKSKEKVIGVIEAINKVQGAFTPADLQLLNSVSMVVTTAIENARLFGELTDAYQQLTKSHAQVLESRNTLRALFDGINDSISIIDRDFQIKAINRAAAALAGAEPQHLVGRNCHAVLCQSSGLCDDRCPITETFRTEKPILKTERRVGAPTATRELEINTWPLENAEGNIERVIYIARDVTEKRKLEASLVQSARLSAVGELAAGVTHEIGNPLTAIIGNTQMLLEAFEPSDAPYRMVKLIESAGLRVEKVVSNLLNLSRQEEYRLAPVDINASIEDALSLVSYRVQRAGVQVTREFQSDLPLISASATYLHTVWTNLLLNAVDSITEGQKGRIQIVTRIDQDQQMVQVIFKDNGSGIAPETLGRIFDPFFTTKAQGKGTGLGLYISQTIMAHHHGTIQVHSQVGQGSTFMVRLPIERSAEANGVQVFAP